MSDPTPDISTTAETPTTPAPEAAPAPEAIAQPEAKTEAAPDKGDALLAKMLGKDVEAAPETKDEAAPSGPVTLTPEESRSYRQILARSGVPAEIITTLAPDKLKALAEDRKPHIEWMDTAAKALKSSKDLEARLAKAEAELAKVKPDPIKATLDKYRNLMEPEDLEVLESNLRAKAKADTDDDDDAGESRVYSPAEQQLARVLVNKEIESLKDQYPGLSDPNELRAVLAHLDQTDRDGKLLTDTTAFSKKFGEAVRIVLGDPAKVGTVEDRLKRNRATQKGQPERPATQPAQRATLTPDEFANESARLFLHDPANASARVAALKKLVVST